MADCSVTARDILFFQRLSYYKTIVRVFLWSLTVCLSTWLSPWSSPELSCRSSESCRNCSVLGHPSSVFSKEILDVLAPVFLGELTLARPKHNFYRTCQVFTCLQRVKSCLLSKVDITFWIFPTQKVQLDTHMFRDTNYFKPKSSTDRLKIYVCRFL